MTAQIKIEKGIPVPSKGRKSRLYPLADMQVGDSFFAPGRVVQQLTAAVARPAKIMGAKFACRTVTENGVKGVRVWRVE